LAEALRIALVALAASVVWFRDWEPFSRISAVGIIGLVIGAWPIIREAVKSTLARRMTWNYP